MFAIDSRSTFARRSSLLKVLLGLLLTMSAGAFAQTYNGSVRGTITDPSGAAVRGATIVLTDNATHQVRNAASENDGVYAFNALRPSVYTLHVEASGFSPADRTDIQVSTQDSLTLDVQLLVGATTNVVKVSAEAPLIDPSTASIKH
jgi:hypothetical protein